MSQTLLLPSEQPSPGTRVDWPQLPGSANALAIVELAKHRQKPTVVVATDLQSLNEWQHALEFYATGCDIGIHVMPDWECLPYDLFSPHQDIISGRLKVLASSTSYTNDIVLIALNTLSNRMCPAEYVRQRTLSLKVGTSLEPEHFRQTLQRAVYQTVSQVYHHGEVAWRGGIIDIYPMGCDSPLRIELFGDEIETIRYFDPQSQLSGDKINHVDFYPAREFALDDDSIRRFRSRYRDEFSGEPKKSIVYREISDGITPAGIEFYLPLFFESTAHFSDYFDDKALWLLPHNIDLHYQRIWAEVQTRHQGAAWRDDRPPLDTDKLFFSVEEQRNYLNSRTRIVLAPDKDQTWDFPAPVELSIDMHQAQPYAAFANYLQNNDNRVLLAAASQGRRELFIDLLKPYNVHPTTFESFVDFLGSDAEIGITANALDKGLALPSPAIEIITESQIYGDTSIQERKVSQAARDPDAIIRSLAELNLGDPIVHDDHGIGRYHGLKNMDINGQKAEFMTLVYQNDDTLYVPVLQLDRVSRYMGGDAEHAPMHKLGTPQWDNARKRAKKRAHDMAIELLENEALRSSRKGISFALPQQEYRDFCTGFMYEETPDQHRAIVDVISDLESDAPMDRLVCGDVGFGKTEVAMRAAFIATWNAKQVAVLVPTTLLAQQHYDNFCERFANTPIKIGLVSRFQTAKETQATLAGINDGTLDIIVGTHRLIQKDVRFKQLGLVILDEEQRFGVRQKEVLKSLRKEVDILTLTATPIPRTLHLAMSGIRSISIIATPPKARLSVKTFVSPHNKAVINEACTRELRRGGQVFILHNRVDNIEQFAAEINEIVPEARVDFAHGQMNERQLESVMLSFNQQRINVLVSTTIIENGIDNPNANTIIINRADQFGLAQLHQLRGRVGRSHHQAYAYLLTPPDKAVMTASAEKRLAAIQALDELGAGFALASQDLEIRGSGELLGENQSGVIDEVGFSQYTRYLRQAIASLNDGNAIDIDAIGQEDESRSVDIDVGAIALIPDDYIVDVHTRLTMYKRLANSRTINEIHELEVEFADRFGLLPEELKTLIDLTELKLTSEKLGVERIHFGKIGGAIAFYEQNAIEPARVIELIQREPRRYKLESNNRLAITAPTALVEERITLIRTLLTKLSAAA